MIASHDVVLSLCRLLCFGDFVWQNGKNEVMEKEYQNSWTKTLTDCKGQFPFRKVSIGSDGIGLFSILYNHAHRRTKKSWKYFNTLSSRLQITDSNWNRKLVPKAHARVQFCSDPVWSHAYCSEWKSAFRVFNFWTLTEFVSKHWPSLAYMCHRASGFVALWNK